MISVSHFRRGPAPLAVAALAVVTGATASCNVIGASCNGTRCGNDVEIFFDGERSYSGAFDGGAFDGGAPPDSYEIRVEGERNQTFVTIVTCWLSMGAARLLVCEEAGGEPYVLGNGPVWRQVIDLTALRVTTSLNGAQLSQAPVSASTTTYPCGCGVGMGTIATAHIQLPPP